MVDPSRLREARERRTGDLRELACHFILVVAVRCERHCGAGDVRGTAAVTRSLVRRWGICCYGHAYAHDKRPIEGSSDHGDLEHNPLVRAVAQRTGRQRRGYSQQLRNELPNPKTYCGAIRRKYLLRKG